MRGDGGAPRAPCSSPVWQFLLFLLVSLLNYLGLVDGGGVRADHCRLGQDGRPQRAVRPPVRLHAVGLGHLRAVCLAVLVIRVLLTGGAPQAFIHLVLVVSHRRVAAAQRSALMALGETSCPRTPIGRDGDAAVKLP